MAPRGLLGASRVFPSVGAHRRDFVASRGLLGAFTEVFGKVCFGKVPKTRRKRRNEGICVAVHLENYYLYDGDAVSWCKHHTRKEHSTTTSISDVTCEDCLRVYRVHVDFQTQEALDEFNYRRKRLAAVDRRIQEIVEMKKVLAEDGDDEAKP